MNGATCLEETKRRKLVVTRKDPGTLQKAHAHATRHFTFLAAIFNSKEAKNKDGFEAG